MAAPGERLTNRVAWMPIMGIFLRIAAIALVSGCCLRVIQCWSIESFSNITWENHGITNRSKFPAKCNVSGMI